MNFEIEQVKTNPIKFNYDDLKNYVLAMIPKHAITYTEEQIKQAKLDRAAINSLINSIDTRRKEVKKIINAPLLDFESKIKEIVAIAEQRKQAIDEQVKAFEARQKSDKRKALEDVFSGYNKFPELLTFEKIFKEEWLNATFSFNKASCEITHIIEDVNAALNTLESTIEGLGLLEFRTPIIDNYFKKLNLSESITYARGLRAQKEQQEKLLGAVPEVERLTAALQEDKEEADTNFQDEALPPEQLAVSASAKVNEEYFLKIICTPSQFAEVRSFLKAKGIVSRVEV